MTRDLLTAPCLLPALGSVKWTFTTRRVDRSKATTLSDDLASVRSGDLILAQVSRIGNHRRVQLADGRHSALYPDDILVLACADRFAPDQFSGKAQLNPNGAALLAGGGVIGELTHRHARSGAPTSLMPLGLLCDQTAHVLNVGDFALPIVAADRPLVTCLVVGTGMNVGKTAAAAGLVNGLSRSGYDTAAIKLTGTGAFGDLQAYEAAGAAQVLDFTDAGMASTCAQPVSRLREAVDLLLSHVARHSACVCELADGISQGETAALLANPFFNQMFDVVLLAASNPLAAEAALERLRDRGVAPCAITGRVTASPNDAEEAAALTGLPLFSREELCDPAAVSALQSMAISGTRRAA